MSSRLKEISYNFSTFIVISTNVFLIASIVRIFMVWIFFSDSLSIELPNEYGKLPLYLIWWYFILSGRNFLHLFTVNRCWELVKNEMNRNFSLINLPKFFYEYFFVKDLYFSLHCAKILISPLPRENSSMNEWWIYFVELWKKMCMPFPNLILHCI